MPNLGTTAPSKVMLQQNPDGAQSAEAPARILHLKRISGCAVVPYNIQAACCSGCVFNIFQYALEFLLEVKVNDHIGELTAPAVED